MTSRMSSRACTPSEHIAPDGNDWFPAYLGVALPPEGGDVKIRDCAFTMQEGILRAQSVASGAQQQTEETFGFKWKQRHTFESEASLTRMREWLQERYGDVARASWLNEYGDRPLIVDAGCGAGMSAIELFGDLLRHARYVGVDISPAVDVAATGDGLT